MQTYSQQLQGTTETKITNPQELRIKSLTYEQPKMAQPSTAIILNWTPQQIDA
jgi:hypothetical protein